MSDRAWIILGYVAYCGIVWFFTVGCPMYAVFVLGHNPWWLLLFLLSAGGYSPWRWYALMDGVERPFSSKAPDTHKVNG